MAKMKSTRTTANDVGAPRQQARDVVFLIAAIQAFMVSFPSLVLSVTKNSDKDSGLMLVFPSKEMTMLSTPGLTKDLNEAVFWAVTTFAFAYYRIYVDGPVNQRLFLLLGGVSKFGSACQLISWVWHRHAAPLLLAFGVLPELGFGTYFLRTWWNLPSQRTTKGTAGGSGNVMFGIAAVHVFLLAVPSFVLSLAGRTADMDLTVASVLDANGIALVSAPGMTQNLYRMFNWLLMCVSYGYYRVAVDGPRQQPLMVVVGILGKLGAVLLLGAGYWQGNTKLAILCIGAVPDLLLVIGFIKVWLDAGATFVPPRTKQM